MGAGCLHCSLCKILIHRLSKRRVSATAQDSSQDDSIKLTSKCSAYLDTEVRPHFHRKKSSAGGKKRQQPVYFEMWRLTWSKSCNLEPELLQQRSKRTAVNGCRQSTKSSILHDTDLQSLLPHGQIYKLYEQGTACI